MLKFFTQFFTYIIIKTNQSAFGGNSAGNEFSRFAKKTNKKVEPAVGIEPTTDGLQNRCSTTELSWLTDAQ